MDEDRSDLARSEEQIRAQFGDAGLSWLRTRFGEFEAEAKNKFSGFQTDAEGKFRSIEEASASMFSRLESDAREETKKFTNTLSKSAKEARQRFMKGSAVATLILVAVLGISLLVSFHDAYDEIFKLQGAVINAQPLVTKAETSLSDEIHLVQGAESSLTTEQRKLADINDRIRDSDSKLKQVTQALAAATQDLEKTRKRYDDRLNEAHGKAHVK